MVLMFITVLPGKRLESSVMVCAWTLIPYIKKQLFCVIILELRMSGSIQFLYLTIIL